VIIITEKAEQLAARLGGHAAALDATAAALRALAAERDGLLLNPDRWRGAINDALSSWMHPILEDEVPKDALQRLIRLEVDAALDPAVSQSAVDLVAQARRDALEEAARAPREIAMGHGLVDVCVCNHEGRYGLVLKPRAEYAPIGQETAPARSVVTLDGGCVVVWFDGPEFARTIIEAIQEAAAIRAATGQNPAQAQAAQ
jgi:hypothetical protein